MIRASRIDGTIVSILFRRYSHQQVQVTPIGSSDLWKIFEFLNVDKERQLEKDILLEQANIDLDYISYCSMAIMNTVIGFVSSFFLRGHLEIYTACTSSFSFS